MLALNLITDRSLADIERWRTLSALEYDAMTTEEKAEWDSGLKGAYNAADLNRVENAVSALAAALTDVVEEMKQYAESLGVAWDGLFDFPYNPEDYAPITKINWKDSDIQTAAEMERYLSNVKLLRGALNFTSDPLPESMNKLTWQGANAIERALTGLNAALEEARTVRKDKITRTPKSWFYSGEVFAGEV